MAVVHLAKSVCTTEQEKAIPTAAMLSSRGRCSLEEAIRASLARSMDSRKGSRSTNWRCGVKIHNVP